MFLRPNGEATSLAEPMHAMSGLIENMPGVADAFRRFRAAYKRVKPALEAPGGMAATLRMAPELAANLDQWLSDNGAAMQIPVRAPALQLPAQLACRTVTPDGNGCACLSMVQGSAVALMQTGCVAAGGAVMRFSDAVCVRA